MSSAADFFFFTPVGMSNSYLAFYSFQSDDKSSYKNKYFTLMSAMKQLQNTFLRAQKNAERNVKGTSTINQCITFLWLFASVILVQFSPSPQFVMQCCTLWREGLSHSRAFKVLCDREKPRTGLYNAGSTNVTTSP